MIGNLGPILSGITMSAVSKQVAARISNDEAAFELSLKVLTGAMTAAGALVGCLHWFTYYLNEREVKDSGSLLAKSNSVIIATPGLKGSSGIEVISQKPSAVAKVSKETPGERKKKLSLTESLRVLAADSYLSQVAVMVLSYGLTMEFTEIIWKASVKKAFPVKTEYLGDVYQ